MSRVSDAFKSAIDSDALKDDAKAQLKEFFHDHKAALEDVGVAVLQSVLAKLQGGDKKGAAEELLRELNWEQTVAVFASATMKLKVIRKRQEACIEMAQALEQIAGKVLIQVLLAALAAA